ncbi:hypothetical protein H5410_013748 [Solanum commersonii]|uniref:Uncharacterized protein n=1 Tax=Solanum commersonii TaxID=4109 RepID=A0A9J5ZPA4_SOLCO|nr:hypothetical protein H5410_013748 [Solanum commersonii]
MLSRLMSDPPKMHYFWKIRHAPRGIFEESDQHRSASGSSQTQQLQPRDQNIKFNTYENKDKGYLPSLEETLFLLNKTLVSGSASGGSTEFSKSSLEDFDLAVSSDQKSISVIC